MDNVLLPLTEITVFGTTIDNKCVDSIHPKAHAFIGDNKEVSLVDCITGSFVLEIDPFVGASDGIFCVHIQSIGFINVALSAHVNPTGHIKVTLANYEANSARSVTNHSSIARNVAICSDLAWNKFDHRYQTKAHRDQCDHQQRLKICGCSQAISDFHSIGPILAHSYYPVQLYIAEVRDTFQPHIAQQTHGSNM